MDNGSTQLSFTYCGVHRQGSMTKADARRQEGLGTVWQSGDQTVFLNWDQTMLANSEIGVSDAQALSASEDLLSAYAAINHGRKQLEDFPVHPTCGVPVATNATAGTQRTALKPPGAFRFNV
jgi:hypothetical protein